MEKRRSGVLRELRPHAVWDSIKEGVKLMLPFLAGLGIRQWVHDHATALMWTVATVVAFGIVFWDRIALRRSVSEPSDHSPEKNQELGGVSEPALQAKYEEAIRSSSAWENRCDAVQKQLKEVREQNTILIQKRSELDKLPRLTIHSAVYGAGHVGKGDFDIADRLRFHIGNGLAMWVQNSALVPRDPAEGEIKRALVKYSFANAEMREVTFQENDLMVLPEPQSV
jgi:hypothetical protein